MAVTPVLFPSRPVVSSIGYIRRPGGRRSVHWAQLASIMVFSDASRLRIGTIVLEPRRGDAILAPAGSEKIHSPAADTGQYWVNFTLEGMAGLRRPMAFPAAGPALANERLERMRRITVLHPRDTLRSEIKFWDFLLDLTLPAPEDSGLHPAVTAAAERIETDLHARLRVADLAAEQSLSTEHLSRLFHRQFGKTVSQYILARRLDKALSLLRSTRSPVKEIAFDVGIPDLQQFNKFIRRCAGVSPRDYRKEAFASMAAPLRED